MPLDMPPTQPPAIIQQAATPVCQLLSPSEAQEAFSRLKKRLPGTSFSSVSPSEVCGLARVVLTRGTVAYTDATGRYLLLALAFDTHRGEPADLSNSLELAIDKRETDPR